MTFYARGLRNLSRSSNNTDCYKYEGAENDFECKETRVALNIYEPWHEIFNNVVYATSKGSDQPAHTRRLIIAFASRLNIR